MVKFLKYLYRQIFVVISILMVSFFLPIVTIEIINNENAYYSATFSVDSIANFDATLLTDSNFLNEIKDSGANEKYKGINVDKMLEKEDFSYTINNNNITITTKIKYYDKFFISSSMSVGTRAKMFIKDSVLKIAGSECNVTFDNPKDIIEIHNYIFNSYLYGLISMGIGSICGVFVLFICFKKNKDSINENNEAKIESIISKSYWSNAIKPLSKVKDITTIAMLFALMLVCKLIPIPSGFGNLGIGFTYLFFAIICMIYGPVYGFVVGIFSDVLGFFFFNGSGFFHLGYTLQAALTGFVYGMCFYRRKITLVHVFISRIMVNFLINVVYGSYLYILVFYPDAKENFGELYKSYVLLMSLPKNIVYLLPQSLLLFYVIKVTLPIFNRYKLVPNYMVNNKRYK